MTLERLPSPFPHSEFLQRLGNARAKMAERGIDALLVTDAANIVYLTGFNAESAYVPQILVVRSDAVEPVLIVRRQDAPGAILTAFMRPDCIIGYPEDYIGHPDRNGYDFIIDRLADFGLASKRLGIEFDSISAATLRQFARRTDPANHIDASGMIAWLRIIKSETEINLIRESAQICDHAIKRATEVILPGVRECDAAGEIAAAICRGTSQFGSDRLVAPLMPSGKKTGTSHLTWTSEPYQLGASVNIELGAFRHRYAGAIMRTVSLGKPSDRLRRLHDATVEGMEAAFAKVRPGATCSDVASAFGAATERRGFTKDSRCGYPIGIDWLEPTASLRVGDRTELKLNMTFHLMLGMWVADDFGYVLSETFRVTKDGSESFAMTPRELFVVN